MCAPGVASEVLLVCAVGEEHERGEATDLVQRRGVRIVDSVVAKDL